MSRLTAGVFFSPQSFPVPFPIRGVVFYCGKVPRGRKRQGKGTRERHTITVRPAIAPSSFPSCLTLLILYHHLFLFQYSRYFQAHDPSYYNHPPYPPHYFPSLTTIITITTSITSLSTLPAVRLSPTQFSNTTTPYVTFIPFASL